MTQASQSYSHVQQQGLGDILRRTAARYPTKAGIIYGKTQWTYAEFDSICTRIANSLAAYGLKAGQRLAILSRNSHAFVAMRFAAARLGIVLVPINFMLNADEIAFILRDSGSTALAVSNEFLDIAKVATTTDTTIQTFFSLPSTDADCDTPPGTIGFNELLEGNSSQAALPTIDASTVLQIVYTSGTESAPKGVMLTHHAVTWQYTSCIIGGEYSPNDIVLHSMPFYHCAQLDVILGPNVYLGATNVIISHPKADVILPIIDRHQVTSFFAPPSIWIALLRSPLFDTTDTSTLQKAYYGASIMPVEVLKEMQVRMPKVRFWNFYGQTEIAPAAAVLGPEDQMRKAGAAGKPMLNVETRIVDDNMEDVAPGEIGEIVHRSPQLMIGYYNNPLKTEEAFKGGWFHSGDLAMQDEEGYITVVDRKKDMIKSGGENVASREVEETLFRLPAVSEVAVIGLPDSYWVEAVTAVIVLRQGHTATEDDVIKFCKGSMAAYKVPKRVHFIEALPKNPSGKILKRDLRNQFM
ncbi:acyl-CoA synthetase [Herbaspirillum robiniae]|uniref:acyl-CoA synthetase n=1 Tax=Herbaspirillum robiniae TaxID=2014887 RepID=UPI003D77A492